MDYKIAKAKATGGPKVLIIAGSGSLFGINSRVLEKEFSLPVVNMAAHASLDLSYYYYILEDIVDEGDIVIMPLEFSHYPRSTITDWFILSMLSWGSTSYLEKISTLERLDFLLRIPFDYFRKNLLPTEIQTERDSLDYIISQVNSRSPQDQFRQRYSVDGYENLTEEGDFSVPVDQDFKVPTRNLKSRYERGIDYINSAFLSERFIQWFRKIENLISERNATLFLTWPATIKNPNFDLSQPEKLRVLEKLKSALDDEGIKIYCSASDFQFELKDFYDTPYHLNRSGADRRSRALASCLKSLL